MSKKSKKKSNTFKILNAKKSAKVFILYENLKNGLLHKEDGHAREFCNGTKEWWFEGKLNRVGEPAIIHHDGKVEYYIDGLRDNPNGPAIIFPNGEQQYFSQGKLHRVDGPAWICKTGNYWYYEGKLHRVDGPAIEFSNGDKDWYFEGKLHRECGSAREYINGDKHWYLHGLRHRVDGPACEYINGDKCWYLHGLPHREGAPAIEYSNGDFIYYKNGVVHNSEGIARKIALSKNERCIDWLNWFDDMFDSNNHDYEIYCPFCLELQESIKNNIQTVEYYYLDGEKVNCSSIEEFLEFVKGKNESTG